MATDRNALSWTSAQVLSDVRRKASLPVTSTDWTDAVILREATDVLWSFAAWALAQGGEGRLLSSLERPITANLSGVFTQGSEVMLPPLAIASTLEAVTWTDAPGLNETRLARIDAADEATYATPGYEGSPACYALIGERIRLYPRPTTGGTLRLTYQRRHPELVTDVVANVGTLLSIAQASPTTTTLTESAGLTGLAIGDTVDVLRGQYPYAPIVASAEVTALPNATTITIDQPLAYLSGHDTAGARIVRAGHSPYVSLPLELRTCVAEKTVANILRTLGDMQGMQAAEQSATMELARVMQMLSPRVKRDKPKAINPSSLMRIGSRRWGW
jgi:hypothetical protein